MGAGPVDPAWWGVRLLSGLSLFSPSSSADAASGGAANIDVFALAERKFTWLDARQKQLSENIANADTPNYKPRDIQSFDSMLHQMEVAPTLTSPMHLAAYRTQIAGSSTLRSETAPDGNAVSLEKEMTKVSQDETQQQLVGNLWKTYMGMFMTALGKSS
jgi:flagellar basal-body rod protein FlgB